MRITRLKITANSLKYLDDLFDAKTGHNGIPNSADIQHFGYTLYLKPSEFLSLAAHASLKPEFYEQCIRNNEPIGYPFLNVRHEEDGYWRVLAHEGRHRVTAIKTIYGDNVLVPVHIFPQYLRNRNLNPTLLKMPYLPEGKDIGKLSLRQAMGSMIEFPPERIDVKSTHLNYNKFPNTAKKHPAEAAVWQSEMMRPHSPANLKKQQRNDDDVTEVLQEEPQTIRVYKNMNPAPKGTSLPRRCN